jgi:hypothetical protein
MRRVGVLEYASHVPPIAASDFNFSQVARAMKNGGLTTRLYVVLGLLCLDGAVRPRLSRRRSVGR